MSKNLEGYAREQIAKAKQIDENELGGYDKRTLQELLGAVMQSLYTLCRRSYDAWQHRMYRAARRLADLRDFLCDAVREIKARSELTPV